MKVIFKYLSGLLICLYTFSSYAENKLNPHSININSKIEDVQCLSCHKNQPEKNNEHSGKYIIPDMNSYVEDGTAMCIKCHTKENSSHIVGITPDYTVPADLPLDKNNQITCLTCHYIHGSLQSDQPMASTSFMDHLFNRDRLSKSFILRRNNAQGNLCLACHSQ